MLYRLNFAAGVCFVALLAVRAGDRTKADDFAVKAKTAVDQRLQELKAKAAQVSLIDAKEVRDMFSGHVFVAVHFRLWPVAALPPQPLKSQNLFAVSKDGKLIHLADAKKLEEFFKSTLGRKLDRDKTVKAWLRLRMEYIQDGFYKFKYPDDTAVALSGVEQAGIVDVVPEMGNKGSLRAVLRFDRDKGTLISISEVNMIVPGIRPRCQATLLLHADPLVRAIAEQDLLVLGRYARAYLMEQRTHASEELRGEIDRVWRRIGAEER